MFMSFRWSEPKGRAAFREHQPPNYESVIVFSSVRSLSWGNAFTCARYASATTSLSSDSSHLHPRGSISSSRLQRHQILLVCTGSSSFSQWSIIYRWCGGLKSDDKRSQTTRKPKTPSRFSLFSHKLPVVILNSKTSREGTVDLDWMTIWMIICHTVLVKHVLPQPVTLWALVT